jgi:CBS domain containing-hemolysin-like protein
MIELSVNGMAHSITRPSTTDRNIARNACAERERPCRWHAAQCITRAIAAASAFLANNATASFLSGEALDTAADIVAWVALILVPIIGIVVFWVVHVMPEKIAHKRHHPQTGAIQTLCLLSLVFGGLLWPIAWLWAYTKPVAYKLAYGTDKHDDYFDEAAARARAEGLADKELAQLKHELDAMHARGPMPTKLVELRDYVTTLQSAPSAVERQSA